MSGNIRYCKFPVPKFYSIHRESVDAAAKQLPFSCRRMWHDVPSSTLSNWSTTEIFTFHSEEAHLKNRELDILRP